MRSLTFDVRDALRTLRRDPAYAATVVLTLALTIGATTAVFSIVDGVLLRPLAYRESQRLVVVQEIVPGLTHLYPSLPANPRHFAAWRARSRSFEQLAELEGRPETLTGAGEPLQLEVVITTGNLFEALGVGAALGRMLRVEDEQKNREPVIVLTDRLWRQRFGGDPNMLGRAVTLDGTPRTVVGVLDSGFRFPEGDDLGGLVSHASAPDAFVPLRIDPEEFSPTGEYNYVVIGRLASGVSVEHSLAELNVLQADIAATLTHEPGLKARVVPLIEAVVGQARRGLMLLLGAIVAVLLMACANLANLSLTRTMARARDAAVRVALGASRARLISRLVIEQGALALAGGACGLLVAYAALALLVRTAPAGLPRVDEVSLNLRVLAFAAGVSIATALLVALVPAWRLVGGAGAGGSLQQSLRAGGLATTSDRGGMRTRAALLATQVALSVTLLAVTLLLAKSFARVMQVDRGFAVDHVLAVDVTLPGARYAAIEPRTRAYDAILDRVRALPGVETASWISNLPLTGESWVDAILPKERKEVSADLPLANYRFVGPAFFETLSIPIRRGRSLAAADLDATRATTPAVVSDRVATRLWPGVDPIGRQFRRGDPEEKPFEIVGVVPDGRPSDLERVPAMMVYVPYSYRSRTRASIVIHTAGDPAALTGAVRQAVWRVDPEIAIANARPMKQLVDDALGGRRYQTTLFTAFSAVALLIAIVGVYAVTAYGVSRRRREMNIRAALGAKPSQALGLVVRQGFAPVAVGVAAGIGGALGIGTLAGGLLFEVSARDPIVIAATASVMGAIGLVACVVAARQGLSLNPAAALREE
jgi:predicted permease